MIDAKRNTGQAYSHEARHLYNSLYWYSINSNTQRFVLTNRRLWALIGNYTNKIGASK